MTPIEKQAVRYFTGNYLDTPEREDGSIDYEALCGEFLTEGASKATIQKHYDNLPKELKREPK